MPVVRLGNSTPRTTSRRSRQGMLVGTLLIVMLFLSGFMVLAANVTRLQQVRAELRASCHAAALAGASQLLDEHFLYGETESNDDVYAAREFARTYGAMNRVAGMSPLLDLNPSNEPTGDIVVGWHDPTLPTGTPLIPATPGQYRNVNAIRVTARMSRNVLNSVSMWFGSKVGMSSPDVAVAVQASLDGRVVGFRPEPGVKVPLVPLVADYDSWIAQATSTDVSSLNDCYTVDVQTGMVTAGGDGIPEIKLVCGLPTLAAATTTTTSTETATEDGAPSSENQIGAATAWCAGLWLPPDPNSTDSWWTRCHEGLSRDDLIDYGGQFVLVTGTLPVALENVLPQDAVYALMDHVGHNRVWPLGEASQNSGTTNVVSFGCGRIVVVRPVANTQTGTSQNGAWEILVQPSTLVCSQAVTAVGMTPNPWIAKLELSQ